MEADGSNPTRLTVTSAFDGFPTWSPDGSRIAFESDRDGNSEIYVMNADGSDQTRLTTDPAFDGFPDWSPNLAAQGAALDEEEYEGYLAFQTNRDLNFEVYGMNVDGTGQVNLTNDPAFDGFPSFSPTGTEIAFETNRDGNNEIYRMLRNGSNQTNLTNNVASDEKPGWSPNGKRIVFVSNRGGMDLDVHQLILQQLQVEVTRIQDALDTLPDWQPVPVVRRPDARIKAKGSDELRGDDIYNTTGFKQTIALVVRGQAERAIELSMENDGNAADTFLVQGPGDTPLLDLEYLFKGKKVTKKVIAGAFARKLLRNKRSELLIFITPRVILNEDSELQAVSVPLVFTVTSENDPSAVDAVRVRVRLP
jgi:dipeptidyl aminopeptidase/acylaminoacyl peptidase